MGDRKTSRENLCGPHRPEEVVHLHQQQIDKEGFASAAMVLVRRTELFIQTETGVNLDEVIQETCLMSASEKKTWT